MNLAHCKCKRVYGYRRFSRLQWVPFIFSTSNLIYIVMVFLGHVYYNADLEQDRTHLTLVTQQTEVDRLLREEQAGFWKERSCTEQIATLRVIIEQSWSGILLFTLLS